MKKILLSISVWFFCISLNAQTYCKPLVWSFSDPKGRPVSYAFEQPPANLPLATPDQNAYPDTHPNKQYVYKVVFHIVTDENYNRITGNVGEAQVMNAIRDLNLAFNQFDIFFKYGGIEYFNNSYLQGNVEAGQLVATFPSITNNDWFHIVILDGNIEIETESGLEEVPGQGFQFGTVAFVSYEGLTNGRVLPHEVGHCFYLYHDFSTYENVTRIESNPGYNAPDYGDRVWDTPASKIWEANQYNAQGEYVGEEIDLNAQLSETDSERFYKTYAPRNNNFMHVHGGPSLQSGYFFSPGQGMRMRWAMDFAILQGYPMYAHAEVDVKELYQPFDSHDIAGEVVNVADNGDGTATVCRQRIRLDRFQKGFNHFFGDLSSGIEISNTPNDLQVIAGETDNYQLKIMQVGEQAETVEIICTRGLICTEEEFQEGFIFVLGMIGSNPITVKQLNEIQVKDPALYEQMLEQYYNVIKKITSTGAVSEKIIYKP